MNGDSEREVALFIEALKLPRRERAAFLTRVCGGDDALRGRLEALLAAYDELGNFMEEPPDGGPSNGAD